MTIDDVRSRYGEPYTAFWFELVPNLLLEITALGGPLLGQPNINGTNFSQEFVNSQVAKNVIIGLGVLVAAFSITIILLVFSMCRNRTTSA